MPNIIISRVAGTPNTGRAYRNVPGSTAFIEETLPASVKATGRLPSIVRFRDQVEMVAGMFDRVLVRDIKEEAWFRSGLEAPSEAPVIALVAGSPGVTGSVVCYHQYLHKIGDRIVHQGNLSRPTLVSPSSQAFQWSLPTIAPDVDRATHISGWRAVDGNLPRRAWTLPLGISIITEEVSTTTLSGNEAPPLRGVSLDINARGVWPGVQWLESYHNSVFGAGDIQHRERLYYTRLYEPESVNTTRRGTWFSTENGEAISGLARFQDELLVGCWPRGFYSVQGYGPLSWRMRKVNDYYQLISHHTMRRVGPEGYLWMLTQHGPVAYVGGGRFVELGDDFYDHIRDDIRANPARYRRAYADADDYRREYRLLVPQADNSSYYWRGEYRSFSRGSVVWLNDQRAREDSIIGQLYTSSDGVLSSVTGSCDGHVRQENVETNADDDGDAFQKRMDVVFRHEVAGDQGGDDAHARVWQGIDLFVKNANQNVDLKTYAGDDSAADTVDTTAPSEQHTLDASAILPFDRGLVPRTSRYQKLDQTVGKGVTVRLQATAPVGVEVRGYGLHFEGRGENVNPEA